ncbi:class I SAM-dependent methyltransferase [Actinomycetospora atypica]|uniref:Class I SAM-dependent methyltransferase n=1 Tax=Actinomycetospora atypica TaxID=1290095 RepID=A0ABV9YFG0_9PSEU
MEHSTHDHAQHGHGHGHADDGQADVLDLDAEVLADHLASVVARLPLRPGPAEIVDLGAGTGTGTLALLDHFPDAHVTAVDASAAHLQRLVGKADRAGVGDRVRTVEADLDAAWPDLGPADLVWASASLHHVADPDLVLRRLRGVLAPGGLLAVVELAGMPRFLPDDAPAGRLEARLHAAVDRRMAEHMPHRGADWGVKLADAGYTLEDRHTLAIDEQRPGDDAVRRYATLVVRGMRDAFADDLPAEDLAALDELLDDPGPEGLARRDDLVVRTERTLWAARP